MRERLSDYQEKYGDLYNLEATPAESTSYRLAKHDAEKYPGIITASQDGKTPYYTNSSHLPVGFTEDVFEALDIQDDLQTLYTSGTVFHAFLGEKLPDWQAAASLVHKIAQHYRLPYFTISPTYSICKNHGYLAGEQFVCPECGEETEVYSRITGYYRPVRNWNAGKAEEYRMRRLYMPENSALKQSAKEDEDQSAVEETAAYLFTTKTCPNCLMAKKLLDRFDVHYNIIDAAENEALVQAYGVMQAPTLVIGSGPDAARYAGLCDIEAYVHEHRCEAIV
jgi:ribonucleoside-triphosphate reductase